MTSRQLNVEPARRKPLADSLRRASNQAIRDGDRFLSLAYQQCAFAIEEHGRLHGVEILLACNSTEADCTVVSLGKDDPESSAEDRRLYSGLELEYTELADYLSRHVPA